MVTLGGNPINHVDPEGLKCGVGQKWDWSTWSCVSSGSGSGDHPYGCPSGNCSSLTPSKWIKIGDVISQPNGNVWGKPLLQDNVCSLPWPIGSIADRCVLEQCQQHDGCYEENSCNASSWALGGNKSCNKCNSGFFK